MTLHGGPHLHGFQLNCPWPPDQALRLYRYHHPDKKIVIQVGARAFEEIAHSPSTLVQYLRRYQDVADYVLLDASGGTGKILDPNTLRPYLEALRDSKINISIGVAGGLGSPAGLSNLEILAQEFPDISIDAESNMRDADDNLDLDAATRYVRTSLRTFTDARHQW